MRIRCLLLTIAVLGASSAPIVAAQEPTTTTWNMSDHTAINGGGSFLTRDEASGNAQTSYCPACMGGDPYVVTSEEAAPSDFGYAGGSGDATVTVYVKSYQNVPAPETEVRALVTAGGATLFDASDIKDVSTSTKFVFTAPYTAGDIAPGTPLKLQVWIMEHNTERYNSIVYPRSTGSEWWSITLPVVEKVPAEPEPGPAPTLVEYSDISGQIGLDFAPAEPLTATYFYNWTTEATGVNISAMATVTDGTVAFAFTDPSGAEIAAEEFAASRDFNVSATDRMPGVWSLELAFDAFVGTFAFDVLEHGVEPVANPGGGGDGTPDDPGNPGTGTPAGNGTGGGKASPGLALPLLAASLGLIALLRRRF